VLRENIDDEEWRKADERFLHLVNSAKSLPATGAPA